jgi:hypothetical protein
MKTHQRRLHVFLFSFLIAMLLFSNGGFAVATAATKTPTVTTTPSATMTATPTITPTPKVDADAEPQAWLDAAINPEKFSTGGRLVVHFNTPIDTTSAVNPLLAWPDVPGSSEWNETQTTLTFTPAAALKGQSSYLFFLNPALRARSGKALKNAPEWQVLTSAGVKVSGITPSFGELDRRYDELTISFDQEMDTSQVEEIVSIEPAIPFNAAWKDGRRLHIQLVQPFDFGQRYRLTVQSGLLAKNGAPLGEDFTGAYQQLPAQARVESITNKEVTITFDYGLSRQKTGLGFSISPALEGEWRWVSDKQVVFKSKDRIPANQIYRIEYPGAVVDLNGFELAPPALQFSGLAAHAPAGAGRRDAKVNLSRRVLLCRYRFARDSNPIRWNRSAPNGREGFFDFTRRAGRLPLGNQSAGAGYSGVRSGCFVASGATIHRSGGCQREGCPGKTNHRDPLPGKFFRQRMGLYEHHVWS